jgi:hypothetical protein
MAIIRTIWTSKSSGDPSTHVGRAGEIWYNPAVGQIILSDGSTPGGIPVSSGGGGGQGTRGYTGSAGLGYTGSSGNTGYNGSTGVLGYTGSIGIGYTGSIGNGYTGSAGYSGSTGELGYTGSIGPSSITAINDQQNTGTGYIMIPNGTTAQRPSTLYYGAMRYNNTTGFAEVYTSSGWGAFGAMPPSISTVTPATYNGEQGTTFTVNGANFTSDATVKFIDVNNVEYTATVVSFVNSTQLTATTPQDFTVAQEPLDVRVSQASGFVTKLDCIDCGGSPSWTTSAGLLATINDEYGSYSPITTVVAADPDAGATLSYSVTSGTLPAGTSLNSTNGQISGNPTNVANQTTSNFNITATDNAGNATARAFSIIVNPVADGSTSARVGASASAIKSATGTTTNGTYWINVRGTPTQLYCDMNTDGGGWMSFAAMSGSGVNFAGSSGGTGWDTTTYSYGTYDSTGGTGSDYWRNYSGQSATQVLFKTGNGTYWIRMLLTQCLSSTTHSSNIATSNNFPVDGNNYNTNITVLYRGEGIPEDPWINAGISHAVGNNYMFWGENGLSVHATFKNNNGGILAFVK